MGKINFRALTENELLILSILYELGQAVQAFQIYGVVIMRLFAAEGKYYRATELRKDIEKEKTLEAVARKFRKQGVKIPSFPTVIKILKDFRKEGWVKKRQIRGRVYYYLSEEVIQQFKEESVKSS